MRVSTRGSNRKEANAWGIECWEGAWTGTELRVIHPSWYHPHTYWTFSWWLWEQAGSHSCTGVTQLAQMFGHWSWQLLPPPCSPGTGAPCACASPSSGTALPNTHFTSTEGPQRDSDPLHYQLQDLLISPKVSTKAGLNSQRVPSLTPSTVTSVIRN